MTTPRTGNLRAALDGLRQQVELGAATQTRESILRMLDKIAALASPSPEPLDELRAALHGHAMDHRDALPCNEHCAADIAARLSEDPR